LWPCGTGVPPVRFVLAKAKKDHGTPRCVN
jgi:hypothetical protein